VDVIYNYLYSTALPSVASNARNQKALCNTNGVALYSYEAGQHLLGDEAKQRAFNTDARMYNLYRAYIDSLHNCGMSILNQFVAVSAWGWYGCWGAKEYAGQSATVAHKYRALFDYLVAQGQFDTDEPKYWEQVAVEPRSSAILPRQLAPSTTHAAYYWLNGRLAPGSGPQFTGNSGGFGAAPGTLATERGVKIRVR